MRKAATSFARSAGSTMLALALIAPAPVLAANGQKDPNTGQRVKGIATQPLEDLNLHKDEIPPKLLSIQDNPYDVSSLRTCKQINAEIGALDGVLGADVDSSEEARRKTVDAMLDVGGGIVAGIMPFRGIVREVTGANAQQRRFQTAIYAGTTRRSYIKGMGRAKGCKLIAPVTVAQIDAGEKRRKDAEKDQKDAKKPEKETASTK